jgi:hypothetical protein
MSDLEDLIARAQMATLSPMSDPMDFLPPSSLDRNPDTYQQMQFSPNVVCIHVTMPELPALSFYDLPGIIGQAESADSHFLVKFVKDLVIEYIKDPESLILVTCSLENDIHNSTAAGIARDLKATNRCIGMLSPDNIRPRNFLICILTIVGVLTKPDRLPGGSRPDRLQAVLDGDRFTLGHGYFVVKNPSQDDIDRGLSHRDARMQERHFFDHTEPWATTLRGYYDRFGTKMLQKSLSETLAGQMGRSLPIIRREAHKRLEGINVELKHLPEPPIHNAARIISDILLGFSSHIRREMEAEYPCTKWRNSWEDVHKEFYTGLLSMKPTMTLIGTLDKGLFEAAMPGKSVDDAYIIESEDEDERKGGDTAMVESPETPSKKRKVESPPGSMRPPPSRNQTPSRATPIRALNLNPSALGAKGFAHLRKQFRLDEVALYLQQTSKSRLPDQLDPKVIDDMIVGTIADWDLPMKRFFEKLKAELRDLVRDIFDEHFGPWKDNAVYNEAWKLVEQLLNSSFTEQEKMMAAESLADEREGPYVFNKEVFNRERANMREQYRQARYRARVKLYGQESFEQTGKDFTPQDQERLRKDEKKQALLRAEPYEKEIEVIARVTSYYLVAARRFYESVCIRIESKFFKRLRTSLRDEIDDGLGIHDIEDGTSLQTDSLVSKLTLSGPKNAIGLLAEPARRFERRKELMAMKNAVLQGIAMLEELQNKYGDDPMRSTLAASELGLDGHSSFGPTSTPLTEEMEDITRSGMALC